MPTAAAGLLLSDDVAPPSIVQTRNTERSSDSARPIYRHRSYVVRGNCYLLPTRTNSIPCFALSHEASLCSDSPPSFARQENPFFVTFNMILISLSPFWPSSWVSRSRFSCSLPYHPAHFFLLRAKLVRAHVPLSFLPLAAGVYQFWCHGH